MPWDGSPPLAWHVAADDRWHSPADETAVRQHRLLGAAVFETRLRVPGGDAVQRVWSVPDCTVVEVTNDSPLPIACALTRSDVVTARPPTDVPIQGIDLPAGSIVLPIGHRATVRAALPHRPGGAPADLAAIPSGRRRRPRLGGERRAGQPPRRARRRGGGRRRGGPLRCPAGRASRRRRTSPSGSSSRRSSWCGWASRSAAVDDVADAVHAIARRDGWDVDAALDAAASAPGAGGRATGPCATSPGSSPDASSSSPPSTAPGIAAVPALERRLARGAALLPDGIPDAWLGASLEAHGVPAGPASTVSFAVRWHGDRPAVLWEVTGEPVELHAPALAPAWRSSDRSGEALWPAQSGSTNAHEALSEPRVDGLAGQQVAVEERRQQDVDQHVEVGVGRQLAALDAASQDRPQGRLARAHVVVQ